MGQRAAVVVSGEGGRPAGTFLSRLATTRDAANTRKRNEAPSCRDSGRNKHKNPVRCWTGSRGRAGETEKCDVTRPEPGTEAAGSELHNIGEISTRPGGGGFPRTHLLFLPPRRYRPGVAPAPVLHLRSDQMPSPQAPRAARELAIDVGERLEVTLGSIGWLAGWMLAVLEQAQRHAEKRQLNCFPAGCH